MKPHETDLSAIAGWDYVLGLRGRASRTRKEYRRVLRALASWLACQDATLITATALHLEQWRADLVHVKGNTVVSYATPVRGFYTWARRAGLRDDDPTLDLDLILPSRLRGQPRPIGEDELENAIVTAPRRVRPWLVLGGYAGLRAIEIAYLERNHLMNTADPAMIWVGGKGGKIRIVPMSPYVWSELLAIELPTRGIVFPRHDGKPGPNTPGMISKLVAEHLEPYGATLHMCRHRFATETLKAANGNLRIVQELLGHASPVTTSVYTAFANPDAVAAVNAIQPKRRGLRAVPEV